MRKSINCKWCGMGHRPEATGDHWIVRSIVPAEIEIKECAYHKAGAVSPIQKTYAFTSQNNCREGE